MRTLLATIAAIAAITFSAQAERAVIYGTLTIISNQFVVKTSAPVETEDEDTAEIIRSSKIQIAGTYDNSKLRTLVGKKVQMDGELFTAHTRYHIEPLLLDISDGDYMERK